MGLVADPYGSPRPVKADSIAVGSAVGAFTLSDLPSIQHPHLFPTYQQRPQMLMHFAVLYDLNVQPFPVNSLPPSCLHDLQHSTLDMVSNVLCCKSCNHVYAGQHACSSTSCIIAISQCLASEQCALLIQVDVEVEASGVAGGVTGVVVGVDVVVVTSSLR